MQQAVSNLTSDQSLRTSRKPDEELHASKNAPRKRSGREADADCEAHRRVSAQITGSEPRRGEDVLRNAPSVL